MSFNLLSRMTAAACLCAAVACTPSSIHSPPLIPMHVTIERSGGFAGLTVRKTLDTGALPENEHVHLQTLLDTANFFTMPAQIPVENPQPDRFEYRISIETNGKNHTVTLPEQVLSPEMKTLVDWLMKSALPDKK